MGLLRCAAKPARSDRTGAALPGKKKSRSLFLKKKTFVAILGLFVIIIIILRKSVYRFGETGGADPAQKIPLRGTRRER